MDSEWTKGLKRRYEGWVTCADSVRESMDRDSTWFCNRVGAWADHLWKVSKHDLKYFINSS